MVKYSSTTFQNISSEFGLFEVQYTTEMNLIIIASMFS